MNIKLNLIFSIAGLLLSWQLLAQPNWPTPSSGDFQYSMTVTAVLNANGVMLEDNTDKVAAFVGSEIRGVAGPTIFVESTGDYVAFIRIWSNSASGELVTFQMYDQSENKLVNAVNTVNFQNNSSSGTNTNPLLITDNNQPTDINLSSTRIDENLDASTVIGVMTSVDEDLSDVFTYSLVDGEGSDDNDDFLIVDDELRSNTIFNYEVKSQYSIRIRTIDSKLGSFEKEFTIQIIDKNDVPYGLNLSASNVDENVPLGTVIGELSTLDTDTEDSHTYTLVPGEGADDNSKFTISGNNLKTNTQVNFEGDQSSYDIRIRTTDTENGIYENSFTINVIDVNEPPTALLITNTEINENSELLTLVGELSTTDEDLYDQHTYSFVEGSNDNESFVLDGSNLKVFVETDFEEKPVYVVRIKTDDGNGEAIERQFVINIADINEAPEDVLIDNFTIAENEPAGTLVGNLSAVDQDIEDEHKFSLLKDIPDNKNFKLVDTQLQSAILLDFETQSAYKVQVEVEDEAGETLIKTLTITVEDVIDGPTGITLSDNRIAENSPNNEVIGLFSVQSPDAEPLDYDFTFEGTGYDNSYFSLDNNSLKTAEVFDHEKDNELNIIVRATDFKGNYVQDTFDIKVIDVNDQPSDIVLSNNNIAENQIISTSIGSLSTVDQDISQSFTYNLEPSLDWDKFIIVGEELRTGVSFDYEEKVFYTVLIKSTDSEGASLTKQFTIEITDDNDSPINIELNGSSVSENQGERVLVGVFEGEDIDVIEELSFALVDGFGGEDNHRYLIEGNQLYTAERYDFEEKSIHKILVEIEDKAGDTFVKSFVIEVLDANDAPLDILLSVDKFNENQAIGTYVAEISTMDVDVNESFTYSLVFGDGGEDIGRFRIEKNLLYTDDLFDSEIDPEVYIRIRSSDGEAAIVRSFVLTVTSVNEKPQIQDQTFRLQEASPAGTVVGLVRALDEDIDQDLTYRIIYDQPVDDREVPFVIDSITGELSVNNASELDYETQPVYNLTIMVMDNGVGQLSDTATVTIRLEDIIELELPANNLISPNDDGKNDVFFIQNVSLYFGYTLVIIDQFGNVVFKMIDYDNSWAGVSDDGRELTTGVYYYRMTSPDSQYIYEGSITLIRD